MDMRIFKRLVFLCVGVYALNGASSWQADGLYGNGGRLLFRANGENVSGKRGPALTDELKKLGVPQDAINILVGGHITDRQALIQRNLSAAPRGGTAPQPAPQPAPAPKPASPKPQVAAAAAAGDDDEEFQRVLRESIASAAREDKRRQEETDRELARRLQGEGDATSAQATADPKRPSSPRPSSPPVKEWLKHKPLIPVEGIGDTGVDIGIDNGRTKQYGAAHFPKAPFFHPYNPSDIPGKDTYHATLCLVFAQLPVRIFMPRLPSFISDASPQINELYWVVQTNPWTDARAAILSRPHYWVNPDAPYERAGYDFHARVHQQCFWPNGTRFYDAQVAAHNHTGPENKIIASPNANHIPELTRPGQSFSFWSVTDYGNRHAATLHWVINNESLAPIQNEIRATIDSPTNNTKVFIGQLRKLRLPEEMRKELDQLFG